MGYWSDSYNGQIFYGADIKDYRNGNETTVFRYCPMCGRKLPYPNIPLCVKTDSGEDKS